MLSYKLDYVIHKLDYALEPEHAGRREAAQCAAHAAQTAARHKPEGFARRLGRLAKRLAVIYLTHQSWKAHEGTFMPLAAEASPVPRTRQARRAGNRKSELRKLAGVKLSAATAEAIWPRVLDHKWYLSERLGRDVGLRVAAVDYFENIEPPRAPVKRRRDWEPLPRLPMMMSLGERHKFV